MGQVTEQVWGRFRNHTATESDLRAIWAENERELADNPALRACPDFEAFMRPLLWQIERMDNGATMAQALAVLATMESE